MNILLYLLLPLSTLKWVQEWSEKQHIKWVWLYYDFYKCGIVDKMIF